MMTNKMPPRRVIQEILEGWTRRPPTSIAQVVPIVQSIFNQRDELPVGLRLSMEIVTARAMTQLSLTLGEMELVHLRAIHFCDRCDKELGNAVKKKGIKGTVPLNWGGRMKFEHTEVLYGRVTMAAQGGDCSSWLATPAQLRRIAGRSIQLAEAVEAGIAADKKKLP